MCGLVQEDQLPPSTRHSKVELPSLELKVKSGVVSADGSAGLESMVVRRGQVDCPSVARGLASELPAGSVARTSKVWLPAPSALSVSGLEHELQPPPSTRHSNVEPPSLELNPNVGVVSLDGSAGVESIVVFGAVLST